MTRPVVLFAMSLSAFVIVAPAHAQASCTLRQAIVQDRAISADYDGFDTRVSSAPLRLRVQADGDCSGASLEVAFLPERPGDRSGQGALLRHGGETLNLQIVDERGRNLIAQDESSAFALAQPVATLNRSGQIDQGRRLSAELAPGQITAPGTFSTRLRMLARLRQAGGAIGPVVETALDADIEVDPTVRLVARGATRIELGELAEGKRAPTATFEALANIAYEIELESDNRWTLQMDGGGGAVPYRALVSNREASRSPDGSAALEFDRPGPDGIRRHTLDVEVLPFGRQQAGERRDFLTLKISPRS